MPEADQLSVRDHTAIFEAVAAREPARALHEMASHLRLISRLYSGEAPVETILREVTRDVAKRIEQENEALWAASFGGAADQARRSRQQRAPAPRRRRGRRHERALQGPLPSVGKVMATGTTVVLGAARSARPALGTCSRPAIASRWSSGSRAAIEAAVGDPRQRWSPGRSPACRARSWAGSARSTRRFCCATAPFRGCGAGAGLRRELHAERFRANTLANLSPCIRCARCRRSGQKRASP